MTNLSDILLGADSATAPFFAVLDGALFENLPDALREGRFVARSLYLDRGENNPEQVVTAPHLVLLDETVRNPALRQPTDTIPALLDLLGGRPAAVFWQCAKGEEALFRHLRGINMVRLPIDTPDGSGATTEALTFRRADAAALRLVLSAFDAPNRAKLFGPATRPMLFGANEALSEDIASAPSRNADAVARRIRAVNAATLDTSRARVGVHLRDHCGSHSDGEMRALVVQAENSGSCEPMPNCRSPSIDPVRQDIQRPPALSRPAQPSQAPDRERRHDGRPGLI